MARMCVVCNHPERHDIEMDLALKVPQRDIAEKYDDVSASAVQRHAVNHMGNQQVRSLVIKGQAEDLVEEGLVKDENLLYQLLAENYATARKIQQEAVDNDNPGLALKALKEARDSLALIQKFTGRLGNEEKKMDEAAELEMRGLIMALKEILPEHRECGKALAAKLYSMNLIKLSEAVSNSLVIKGEVL